MLEKTENKRKRGRRLAHFKKDCYVDFTPCKMDGTQICKMNKFFYFISFKIALFIGRLKINSKEAGGGPFPFPSKFHFLQEALSASS